MCGYFCIGFIDFMLKAKSLIGYTNLLFPNDYEKNDKIILKRFSIAKEMKKIYCVICGKHRKFEKPKMSYLLKKILVFSIVCSKCKNEDEKIFKGEESTKILKVLGLIENIYYFKNMAEENISQWFRFRWNKILFNWNKVKWIDE